MVDRRESARSTWFVFWVFLRLGLTSFGGPVAHLGYFHNEFVERRRWLSEQSYADLVALCQFLPGPASSQVGMAIGLLRSGYKGAFAAWLGFTLPSAIVLILFALGVGLYGHAMPVGVLQGLKIVAVAVVAQAVWGMARQLCLDAVRVTLMVAACCAVLWLPFTFVQVIVIAFAALLGMVVCKASTKGPTEALLIPVTQRTGVRWLLLFVVLLIGLPLLALLHPSVLLSMADAFYRAGALVFGGGHVVLPLLQADMVPTGLVSNEIFLAGYGAAQAVPGPLFTFAAFLGASLQGPITGWWGGLIAVVVIFVPSFLLVVGALPFWEQLRRNQHAQSALMGVNAAVVGLLVAALYDPVWTSAIHTPRDFAVALVALVALMVWKLPPWLVVLGTGGLVGVFAMV